MLGPCHKLGERGYDAYFKRSNCVVDDKDNFVLNFNNVLQTGTKKPLHIKVLDASYALKSSLTLFKNQLGEFTIDDTFSQTISWQVMSGYDPSGTAIDMKVATTKWNVYELSFTIKDIFELKSIPKYITNITNNPLNYLPSISTIIPDDNPDHVRLEYNPTTYQFSFKNTFGDPSGFFHEFLIGGGSHLLPESPVTCKLLYSMTMVELFNLIGSEIRNPTDNIYLTTFAISFGPEIGPCGTRICETKSQSLVDAQATIINNISKDMPDDSLASVYTVMPTDMSIWSIYANYFQSNRLQNNITNQLFFSTSNTCYNCRLTPQPFYFNNTLCGDINNLGPSSMYAVQPDYRSTSNNMFQKARDPLLGCIPPVRTQWGTNLFLTSGMNGENTGVLLPTESVPGAPFLHDLIQNIPIHSNLLNVMINLNINGFTIPEKTIPLYCMMAPWKKVINLSQWSYIYNYDPLGYSTTAYNRRLIYELTNNEFVDSSITKPFITLDQMDEVKNVSITQQPIIDKLFAIKTSASSQVPMSSFNMTSALNMPLTNLSNTSNLNADYINFPGVLHPQTNMMMRKGHPNLYNITQSSTHATNAYKLIMYRAIFNDDPIYKDVQIFGSPASDIFYRALMLAINDDREFIQALEETNDGAGTLFEFDYKKNGTPNFSVIPYYGKKTSRRLELISHLSNKPSTVSAIDTSTEIHVTLQSNVNNSETITNENQLIKLNFWGKNSTLTDPDCVDFFLEQHATDPSVQSLNPSIYEYVNMHDILTPGEIAWCPVIKASKTTVLSNFLFSCDIKITSISTTTPLPSSFEFQLDIFMRVVSLNKPNLKNYRDTLIDTYVLNHSTVDVEEDFSTQIYLNGTNILQWISDNQGFFFYGRIRNLPASLINIVNIFVNPGFSLLLTCFSNPTFVKSNTYEDSFKIYDPSISQTYIENSPYINISLPNINTPQIGNISTEFINSASTKSLTGTVDTFKFNPGTSQTQNIFVSENVIGPRTEDANFSQISMASVACNPEDAVLTCFASNPDCQPNYFITNVPSTTCCTCIRMEEANHNTPSNSNKVVMNINFIDSYCQLTSSLVPILQRHETGPPYAMSSRGLISGYFNKQFLADQSTQVTNRHTNITEHLQPTSSGSIDLNKQPYNYNGPIILDISGNGRSRTITSSNGGLGIDNIFTNSINTTAENYAFIPKIFTGCIYPAFLFQDFRDQINPQTAIWHQFFEGSRNSITEFSCDVNTPGCRAHATTTPLNIAGILRTTKEAQTNSRLTPTTRITRCPPNFIQAQWDDNNPNKMPDNPKIDQTMDYSGFTNYEISFKPDVMVNDISMNTTTSTNKDFQLDNYQKLMEKIDEDDSPDTIKRIISTQLICLEADDDVFAKLPVIAETNSDVTLNNIGGTDNYDFEIREIGMKSDIFYAVTSTEDSSLNSHQLKKLTFAFYTNGKKVPSKQVEDFSVHLNFACLADSRQRIGAKRNEFMPANFSPQS
jgi:hypothetical protein